MIILNRNGSSQNAKRKGCTEKTKSLWRVPTTLWPKKTCCSPWCHESYVLETRKEGNAFTFFFLEQYENKISMVIKWWFLFQYCHVGRLSHEVGWKYKSVVRTLENKRRVRSIVEVKKRDKLKVNFEINLYFHITELEL